MELNIMELNILEYNGMTVKLNLQIVYNNWI